MSVSSIAATTGASILALSSNVFGMSSMSSMLLDNPTISQGDRIVSDSNTYCTIGWVSDDYFITAAHCAKNGLGSTVYNAYHQKLGTVVEFPTDDYSSNTRSDWAVIDIEDNVTTVGNGYSGNDMIARDEVTVGDELCTYGATTKKVSCGKVRNKNWYTVRTEDTTPTSGDSGGPSWVAGKGFIGIHRGPDYARELSVTIPIPGVVPNEYL